jgi:hypothetical protein
MEWKKHFPNKGYGINSLAIFCPYLQVWSRKFCMLSNSFDAPVCNSSQRCRDREKNLNTFLPSFDCSNFYGYSTILLTMISETFYKQPHESIGENKDVLSHNEYLLSGCHTMIAITRMWEGIILQEN